MRQLLEIESTVTLEEAVCRVVGHEYEAVSWSAMEDTCSRCNLFFTCGACDDRCPHGRERPYRSTLRNYVL